jgi:hypothetical protein
MTLNSSILLTLRHHVASAWIAGSSPAMTNGNCTCRANPHVRLLRRSGVILEHFLGTLQLKLRFTAAGYSLLVIAVK